jgi:hypothetical protein
MRKIKEATVANTFYTGSAEDLILQIQNFKETSKNLYKYATRAVIVPHAGLVYSGRLAYEGIFRFTFEKEHSHQCSKGGTKPRDKRCRNLKCIVRFNCRTFVGNMQ